MVCISPLFCIWTHNRILTLVYFSFDAFIWYDMIDNGDQQNLQKRNFLLNIIINTLANGLCLNFFWMETKLFRHKCHR